MGDVSLCLQGEFFGRNWRSPAPFDAPPIRLPEKQDHPVYFAVSEYVFNTASRVYHQAGRMNFTIQNQHVSKGRRSLGVPGESVRQDGRPRLAVFRERTCHLKPAVWVQIQAVPQFPSVHVDPRAASSPGICKERGV